MENEKRARLYKILTKFALELATVIAGILIALFVNQVQERERDRRVLYSTLNGLAGEFKTNIENITKLQPVLERFMDTLHFYETNRNLSLYDLTTRAEGLGSADLYTTNWQVTLSSNSLRLLDFKTITLLSQIDAKHHELKDQATVLLSIVYSTSMYRTGIEGWEYRKLVGVWIGGYRNNQNELIALYAKFDDLMRRENIQ